MQKLRNFLSHPLVGILFLTIGIATLVGGVVLMNRQLSRIEAATTCSYFVNVTEWVEGTESYRSPDIDQSNPITAQRSYEEAISDWKGLCDIGLCLDSCKVELLKVCPDDNSVPVVIKSEVIVY